VFIQFLLKLIQLWSSYLNCDCDVDEANEFDVFISYCQVQQKIVHQIADRLKKERFKIWIDTEQMSTYQFGLLFYGSGHIIVISDREFVLCWSHPYVYLSPNISTTTQAKRDAYSETDWDMK